MRLGCVLVSLALLTSLILQPPKAKAFALTSGAISALAGGFLAACGLTPVVSGMGSSEQANEALGRLIQDFLDEKHPGVKDAVEWVGAGVLTVTGAGKVMIPKSMAEKFGQFAAWVASKFGMNADGTVKPGENVVYSNQTITFLDGSTYNLSSFGSDVDYPHVVESTNYNLGTDIIFGTSQSNYSEIVFCSGYSCKFYKDDNLNKGSYYARRTINGIEDETWTKLSSWSVDHWISCLSISFFIVPSTGCLEFAQQCYYPESGKYTLFQNTTYVFLPSVIVQRLLSGTLLSLDVAESITIPEGLTDTQSVALDVGATESMSVEQILQGILDAILAGDLTATAEVVDTAEQPVDPEDPTIPVVPKGLDELGAALTSRFPFSIPWDVYKGVQLLAAPAQAPYFEVDFFAPIAQRVGGWKGSTKIVLDMSEYEIIGQVSRWASTIGFCLMLASGTKRLIWTA